MLRDFKQKERNKPVKITDIAIEKVRRTKIFGFVDDENRYIQEAHKRLLQISQDENNSEEVAIVIDIIQWEESILRSLIFCINMEVRKMKKTYSTVLNKSLQNLIDK